MPRKKGFYSLKKIRIRQSWNKRNLYNLWRLPPVLINNNRTFFQRKWTAKSLTRGYHGEQIRERKWNQMFSRWIPSVVSMDPKVLAQTDGSDMAAGRGSGKEDEIVKYQPKFEEITPYMSMVFHPMERRLDTAVFRAMFASSARQARQFVVHGYVKVNGKKMQYPGYLLNPGDMFSVNPEMVLYATGMQKGDKTYRPYRSAEEQEQPEEEEEEDLEEEVSEEEEKPSDSEGEYELSSDESSEPTVDRTTTRKRALLDLRKQIKEIESKEKEKLSAKRIQELRVLKKEASKLLTKLHTVDDALIETFQSELDRIVDRFVSGQAQKEADAAASSLSSSQIARLAQQAASSGPTSNGQTLTPRQHHAAALAASFRSNTYNPLKPYKTPWEPRPLLSAFAFIPRYLEVNQNVCSAVYLRHPVARPGISEVPSPFPYDVSQLAFNWYLRRR